MGAGALTGPSFEATEKLGLDLHLRRRTRCAAFEGDGKARRPQSIASRCFGCAVFNDYSVFTDDGFLSLALDLFAWLDTRGARMCVRAARRTDDGARAASVVAQCDGDLEARTRVLFRVFDFNLDGKLDRESAGTMMGVFVEVLQLIGVLPEQGRHFRGGREKDEPALPRL